VFHLLPANGFLKASVNNAKHGPSMLGADLLQPFFAFIKKQLLCIFQTLLFGLP